MSAAGIPIFQLTTFSALAGGAICLTTNLGIKLGTSSLGLPYSFPIGAAGALGAIALPIISLTLAKLNVKVNSLKGFCSYFLISNVTLIGSAKGLALLGLLGTTSITSILAFSLFSTFSLFLGL